MKQLTTYQKRALKCDEHISLTANAGSGKTFVLSKRYVEIALNARVPLSKIVAITFTDKAAGDLYKKISGELEERIINEKEHDVKRKLESIRRQLVNANISTIHSFCIDILKEFSPLAGIDANFIPIDQQKSQELIDVSIEETISTLLDDENESENVKHLIRVFGSRLMLTKELSKLIGNRKNVIKLSLTLYQKSVDEIAGYFRSYFEEKFKEYFADTIDDAVKAVRNVNDTVLANDDSNKTALKISGILNDISGTKDTLKLAALFNELLSFVRTGNSTVRKSGYLKDDWRTDVADDISLIESLPKKLFELDDNIDFTQTEKELAKLGFDLIWLFKKALLEYDERKRENGFLDFEDILLNTQTLLKKETVNDYLAEKYNYIMVDEYQDTNEIQYDIVMPILNYLRQGNLFVVGDDKQSIYMFRDAELEIFKRTKDEIVQASSEKNLLELPHSFRMAPGLALFTNELFKRLFVNPQVEFNEVAHSEILCAKDENEQSKIELLVTSGEEESLPEAELVARRIKKLAAEESLLEKNYGNVAVLCRQRKSFEELEQAFVKYNIPYNILDGKGFYQRQVIYDIRNYLSFLLSSEDDASLIGVLRSPFYSVSDTEIFEISHEHGNSFWEKLKSYSQNNETLRKAADKIESHLGLAFNKDINFILRTILADTGYTAVIANRINAAQELANIDKLIDKATDYSQQSFKTLYDFVDFLNEAIDELDDESQAAAEAQDNSVNLLTIHKSKGLEFKAVFVYDCNSAIRRDTVKAKSVTVDKNMGLLSKVPDKDNYFADYVSPPVVSIYNYASHRKNIAENMRLLYVAATRAENYLFFSAKVNKDVKEDSFMGLVVNGLGVNLEDEVHNINAPLGFIDVMKEGSPVTEKEVSIAIPIISEIEDVESSGELDISGDEAVWDINIEEIKSVAKGEIISATKVAMYLQCPVKYELTYELGYTSVLEQFKKYFNSYEFNEKEDDETREFADVRGRVIHKLLEKDEPHTVNEPEIKDIIQKESGEIKDESKLTVMAQEIRNEINTFVSSGVYEELSSYDRYKNEFEIYTQQKDYFLYGIIDKLIIDDNRLIVVDYKTDRIKEEQIKERAESYMPQLKFYAYVLSRAYDVKQYVLRLVFVRHPEKKIEVNITKEELKEFDGTIERIVNSVRLSEFKHNLSHCGKCHFAIRNGKCVK